MARIIIFGQTRCSSNIRKYTRGSYSSTEMGATFFLAMLCERMWLAAYMEKVKRILLSCIPPFMNYHHDFFQQQKNIIDKQLQRSLEKVKKKKKVVQILLARAYHFYSACHIPLLTQADLQTNSDVKRCKCRILKGSIGRRRTWNSLC